MTILFFLFVILFVIPLSTYTVLGKWRKELSYLWFIYPFVDKDIFKRSFKAVTFATFACVLLFELFVRSRMDGLFLLAVAVTISFFVFNTTRLAASVIKTFYYTLEPKIAYKHKTFKRTLHHLVNPKVLFEEVIIFNQLDTTKYKFFMLVAITNTEMYIFRSETPFFSDDGYVYAAPEQDFKVLIDSEEHWKFVENAINVNGSPYGIEVGSHLPLAQRAVFFNAWDISRWKDPKTIQQLMYDFLV